MKVLAWPALVLALLCLGPACARPQQPPQAAERLNILVDNDMWGHPRSDDNYTMGVSITRYHLAGTRPELWQGWLERLNGTLGVAPAITPKTLTHWILGSSNFTPTDIRGSAPIRGDRPYASLLYLGSGYWSTEGATTTETQLQFGVLGTNIGKSVQTAIHKRCCKDRLPQGWDNQIGDGGAPTFLYHVKWSQPTGALASDRSALIAGAGVELGYLTRAMLGATLYWGASPSDYRAILLQPASNPPPHAPMLMPSHAAIEHAEGAAAGYGLSAWLDLEVSAIAYNQLLQGAWGGRNVLTYSYSEIAPVVGKVNAGIELTFLPRAVGLCERYCRVYATQSWRSRDLRNSGSRNHYWGGFIVALSF